MRVKKDVGAWGVCKYCIFGWVLAGWLLGWVAGWWLGVGWVGGWLRT